jgi:hypothetical protein
MPTVLDVSAMARVPCTSTDHAHDRTRRFLIHRLPPNKSEDPMTVSKLNIPLTMTITLVTACGDDLVSIDGGTSGASASDSSASNTNSEASSQAESSSTDNDSTNTGDSTATETDTGDDGGVVEPEGTNVLLQVIDIEDTPIPSAKVTFDGVEYLTDGAGFILFDNLEDGRFTARIDAYGYTSGTVGIDVGGGSSTYRQFKLFPLGPPMPFDSDHGGQLEHEGVRVDIPPYVLVDRNGEPVTGMVEATITPIDPTSDDLDALPGPLEGINELDEDVGLLSVAMAEISLWQDGQPLELAPGALAQIEFEIPVDLAPAYQPGDEIPIWSLDLDEGVWLQDGVGTVAVAEGDPDQLVWTAEVEHFTHWNADPLYPWDNAECFIIALVDQNGNFVANQHVSAEGLGPGGNGVSNDDAWTRDTNSNVNGGNCLMKPFGSMSTLSVPAFNISQPLVGPGVPSHCWANSPNPCTVVNVMVQIVPPVICTPGSTQSCGYSGPPLTQDVGICRAATNYCIDGGTAWSGCMGEVLPAGETCSTDFDDNCNGQINEAGALNCGCAPGDMMSCYNGPAGTQDVGLCAAGSKSCDILFGTWNVCTDAVTPVAEDCMSAADENCNGIASCEGAAVWATGYGDGANTQGRGIAVNTFGDVYTVGSFDGSIEFGTGTLMSAGSTDIFLVKQDVNGVTQWAKRFGAAGADAGLSVDLDGSGNILITGIIYDMVDVDGNNIPTVGGGDILVAKFDANGVHHWSMGYGGADYDAGLGIASNSAGDVFVTGTSSGNVFPGVMGIGPNDAFILGISGSNGAFDWARVYGGGVAVGLGIDVDSSDDLLATGYFSQSIDFGGGGLNSAGDTDMFVVELDGAGAYEHAWSARHGGALADAGHAIATDPLTGALYLTGRYIGAVDFGGGPVPVYGGNDIFVVSFDTNGTHQWSTGWGAASGDEGLGIAYGAGGVTVTGRFNGAVDFGGGALMSVGGRDVMLVKLTTSGGFVWAERFGLGSDDGGMAVTANLLNQHLTGYFSGDVDFGTGALPNPSGFDVVIAKYDQ